MTTKWDEVPGFTPLHRAALEGDLATAERLIGQGADVHAQISGAGLMPWHLALEGGHQVIADLLEKNGAQVPPAWADWTSLHWASRRGDVNAAEVLIDDGADVNAATEMGETPLSVASSAGHAGVAELLITRGADPNASFGYGQAPLAAAGAAGNRGVMESLIARGADVNKRGRDGGTLLHEATEWSLPAIELLLAKGTDVNAKDESGKTPLHSAVSAFNSDVVKLLVERGADVNASDENGYTPLDEAQSLADADYWGDDSSDDLVATAKEIIGFLESRGAASGW